MFLYHRGRDFNSRQQWNDNRLEFNDQGGKIKYLTMTERSKVGLGIEYLAMTESSKGGLNLSAKPWQKGLR